MKRIKSRKGKRNLLSGAKLAEPPAVVSVTESLICKARAFFSVRTAARGKEKGET
jgi:hypothetical protein